MTTRKPTNPPLISVSTANFFSLPFEHALDLIAAAGFRDVELDLFVEYDDWAMAQHLKGWTVREAVRQIAVRGLRVASIHDGGGVLHEPDSLRGYINPLLDEYLDQLGYAPGCIVFHTPHLQGRHDPLWWQPLTGHIHAALEQYRGNGSLVTVENLFAMLDYTIPFTQPEELLNFLDGSALGITLDTIHYAQADVDITHAAEVLGERVYSVHLSDSRSGRTHLYPGEGRLDFDKFFHALKRESLYAVTLECSFNHPGEDLHELPDSVLVERLAAARTMVAAWLAE